MLEQSNYKVCEQSTPSGTRAIAALFEATEGRRCRCRLAEHAYTNSEKKNVTRFQLYKALFSSKNFCKIDTVAFSFVFDKNCPIID